MGSGDLSNSKYQFAPFNAKRYDISNLNPRLLCEPPLQLAQHMYKEEVINYVLDKAFIAQQIKNDYVITLS